MLRYRLISAQQSAIIRIAPLAANHWRNKLLGMKLDNSKNEPYRISLTPRLRKDVTQNDRWTIYIPVFMIDLPVGCGFPLEIPLESRDYDRTSNSGKITRWEVKHIGPPPTK